MGVGDGIILVVARISFVVMYVGVSVFVGIHNVTFGDISGVKGG